MTAESTSFPRGWRLIVHDIVASTNDEAMGLAHAGACEGTVVQARRQQAGRGRQGRNWVSEPGNLFCSTIVRPCCPPAQAAVLGFVAANATAAAVGAFVAPGRVAIKWPNDVLVDRRKVAGILLEADIGPDGDVAAMVIGIGINVAHAPEVAAYPVASLAAASGDKAVDADLVLEYLCGALHHELQVWRSGGFPVVRERWLARCVGLGEPVTVRMGTGVERGRFEGLGDDGALLLRRDGKIVRITAGDVWLPGAAGG